MLLLLFGAGFLAIGGEWFAMWQSKSWNGLEAATRNVTLAGIALLVVHLPGPAGRGEEVTGRAGEAGFRGGEATERAAKPRPRPPEKPRNDVSSLRPEPERRSPEGRILHRRIMTAHQLAQRRHGGARGRLVVRVQLVAALGYQSEEDGQIG